MATAKPAPATAEAPPAAAIRALTYAVAGLGRQLGIGSRRDSASTVVQLLGATEPDARALHEYLNHQGG